MNYKVEAGNLNVISDGAVRVKEHAAVAGLGWVTDLSLSVPPTALPGATVLVRAVVQCFAIGGTEIWTIMVVDGYTVVSKKEFFSEDETKWYDYALTMPNRPVKITAGTFIVNYYTGAWEQDDYEEFTINPREPAPAERYWITTAEGKTEAELEADAEGKYIEGSFRLVVEVLGAPSWVLESGAWLFTHDPQAILNLRALGVEIVDYKVRGNTIYVCFQESPHVIQLTILIPILVAIVLIAIGVWVVKPILVQKELTKQLAIDLQIAKVKADAQKALLEAAARGEISPEMYETILKMWESGYGPEGEKEGIDWEKYLKWGLIGGGVILVIALIVPRIPKFVKELSEAKV